MQSLPAPPNLTQEQLRELVQGPGEEWTCVLCFPQLYDCFVTYLYVSSYEMRRDCQEILPGVLLGPMQASKSLETLQQHKITHMYGRP